jgi:alkylation response protein AidB-like acyl-CoA dehydrogenase
VDFRLDDDQVALRDAVSGFCSARYPLDAIGGREGAPLTSQQWVELADLGVFGLLVPESDGGLGLGLIQAAIVFEQLGLHLVEGPILWSTLGATVLGGACDGETIVGGYDATAALVGDPILVEHAADLDVLLVLRDDGVFAIDAGALPAPDELDPLDPLTPVGRFADLPTGTQIAPAGRLPRLRAEATVLTAAQLLGLSDAALTVARDYALEREQFGQPIATFQALKHMMADMFVRTGLARSATYAAAAVLDDPDVGHVERSVSAAKLLAGDAAVENSRAAIQVLGGMGFTWEMLPNHLLKRAWVLEESFGTSSSHALAISASLARDDR